MAKKKVDYNSIAQKNIAAMERQATGKTSAADAPPVKETGTQEGEAAPVVAGAKRGRGRPASEQDRVAFTTRVRADVRRKINIAAATYDVKPSDIIDALVDQYLDALNVDKIGTDRY